MAQLVGSVAARRSSKRAIVARNLARLTGEEPDSARVQKLVVAAYRSYARYWLETFRLVREGPEFFLDRFRCEGQEHLDGVLARGKGAIIVIGHLGNWDAAGAWVGARGNSLVTVAEVLRPRRMFDFFVEHRARLGMTIYPAERGVTDRLVASVESGAVVAILGDRDLKGTGPRVTFCGEEATFPAGAASVAMRTGVPIVVAGIYGVELEAGKRGWAAQISAPIELPDPSTPEPLQHLTQQVADHLAVAIKRRPEEWHVFQPFWIADRVA